MYVCIELAPSNPYAYLLLLGWFRAVCASAELKLAARFRQTLAITSQAAVVEALKNEAET